MPDNGKRARYVPRRALLIAIAALPVVAQVPSPVPPKGIPAVPPAPTASDELQKAYASVKEASGRLANIPVPMVLEPAFAFHV